MLCAVRGAGRIVVASGSKRGRVLSTFRSCSRIGRRFLPISSSFSRVLCSSPVSLSTHRAMVPLRDLEDQSRLFGPWTIAKDEIFAESATSFAFVNTKPVVPGHVLVAPKRVCKKFTQLSMEEVADLWQLAKVVGGELESHAQALFYEKGGEKKEGDIAMSLTLCIQDGPQAAKRSHTFTYTSCQERRETSRTMTKCMTQ